MDYRIFIGILLSILVVIACNRFISDIQKTRTLEEPVVINRLYTDEYEILLKDEGPWEFYRSENPMEVFADKPFLELKGDTLLIKEDIPTNKRIFFGMRHKEKGDTTYFLATERRVPLEGQGNFRDLGGLPTQDGRITSWGKIFRSGKLDLLTPQDLAYLKSLKIKTVLDFRNDIEVRNAPDIVPDGAEYVRSPIADKEGAAYRVLMRQIVTHKVRSRNAKDKFKEVMVAFVDTAASDYKPVFDQLLYPARNPLVFHCSGGKDRTGAIASIILLALGVDEKTVKEEYLMSNFYRYELNLEKMRKGRKIFIGKETLEMAFVVQEAYIDAVFEVINDKYEGIDNYLQQKFDISPEERRWLIDHYTYDINELIPAKQIGS